MKKPILGCDVDLTVVDILDHWVEWYETLTGHSMKLMLSVENNVERLMTEHDDPLEFWRKTDLYDDKEPIWQAVEVLERLSEKFDIVFVSHSMPEHTKSKEYFLKRHFPFAKGFVATKDKQYVRVDAMIDDFGLMLQKIKEQDDNVVCVQIKTKINDNTPGFPYLDWFEIEDHLNLIFND